MISTPAQNAQPKNTSKRSSKPERRQNKVTAGNLAQALTMLVEGDMSLGKISEMQRRDLLRDMEEAIACQHAKTVEAMVLDFRSMRKGLHDIMGLRYGGACYDTDSHAQGWLETLIIIQAQLESLTSKETPDLVNRIEIAR